MDPMQWAKLLMQAGQANPEALSMLDMSGVPTPDSPAFADLINPGNSVGAALMGSEEANTLPVATMAGTDLPYPPGIGPAAAGANPLNAGVAPPRANPPGQGSPTPQLGQGTLGDALKGIGKGLGSPPKPSFYGGVPGTPKGLADTVHKPPANAMSPAQLMLALLGRSGRGAA